MTDAFIDTNILLYAASDHPAEATKAALAQTLLESINFGISVQVLQEFYVNATGKLAATIPEEKVTAILSLLKEQEVLPLTTALFDAAVEIKRDYQLSYWDAAIIAAAKQLNAKTIYSEDLAHGQTYREIRVVNPFLGVS